MSIKILPFLNFSAVKKVHKNFIRSLKFYDFSRLNWKVKFDKWIQ
ncbi:hypothetical protein D1BOALGB6SA_2373 [Olavius sp. associated proteobacterium Delta 1]|nr:hypothetical protein D1BOALGB6SA_2373 [Olavius sp. associated proteobacterium Delta 1]